MKALVLAGGYGKRLRPLTYSIPKQLVPIANRPIISYVIEQIRTSGIRDVGIVVSPHTKDQIIEALDTEGGLDFTFIVQKQPLGLAHAVLTARSFLGEDPFLMYLGDNLIGDSISDLVTGFDRKSEDGLILLKEVADPSMFGVATVDGDGRITGLVEKPASPPSNLALVGVYLFTPIIHEAIRKIKPSSRGEYEITDAISELLKSKRRIRSEILNCWWLDTGKKDDLLVANRIILDELKNHTIDGQIDDRSRLGDKVTIGKESMVSNSVIRGPSVIGENTTIKDSEIGPHSAIGNGCRIINSKLCESVIMDRVSMDNVNQLSESIIGQKSVITQSARGGKAIRLLVGDASQIEI